MSRDAKCRIWAIAAFLVWLGVADWLMPDHPKLFIMSAIILVVGYIVSWYVTWIPRDTHF